MRTNKALILVAAELTTGMQKINDSLREISKICPILASSAVYKRYHNNRKEDLNSEICSVILLQTEFSILELADLLRKFSGSRSDRSELVVRILSFGDEVRLTPSIPLPNPALHSDYLVLKCATEIYGKYLHPVLGKTLDEILAGLNTGELIEFFAQPKALFK